MNTITAHAWSNKETYYRCFVQDSFLTDNDRSILAHFLGDKEIHVIYPIVSDPTMKFVKGATIYVSLYNIPINLQGWKDDEPRYNADGTHDFESDSTTLIIDGKQVIKILLNPLLSEISYYLK